MTVAQPVESIQPRSAATIRSMAFLTLIFVWLLPISGVFLAAITLVMGQVSLFHVAMFFVGWLLTGTGITVGYHRLATHRSFETHPFIKGLLLILGSMAAEGPVLDWVANHVKHHANSDRQDDPHTPTDGFMHAHWWWLVRFGEIDSDTYAPFIRRDPVAMFVSRTFIIWVTLGYVVPFLIGGWTGLIWGGFLRAFWVYNVTFAVNSVCHKFGSRPYPTGDLSTNNWIVGVLGLGEGWHNNHHAFPFSAAHGLRWWQIDVSAWVIRLMRFAGLAWNVRHPTEEQMRSRLNAAGINS
jgi:stearoyl-CoA desaturase (delta-9 desaturase)